MAANGSLAAIEVSDEEGTVGEQADLANRVFSSLWGLLSGGSSTATCCPPQPGLLLHFFDLTRVLI